MIIFLCSFNTSLPGSHPLPKIGNRENLGQGERFSGADYSVAKERGKIDKIFIEYINDVAVVSIIMIHTPT